MPAWQRRLFAKGGNTDKVWFYEMENCGFSLDDKQTPIDDNDIPEIKEFYQDKKESKKSFNVSKEELVAQDYSLLPSKYKEVEYKPRVFEHIRPHIFYFKKSVTYCQILLYIFYMFR